MSWTKERYAIAPQLKDYDNLPSVWKPYTMFCQYPNYVSESVNTDDIGQRFTTLNNGERLNISTIKGKCDLLIGASTAFGVGATHDRFSISSVLSDSSGRQVISLSGRAYNSRQELLLFIENMHLFDKIENIIIMSGANNLYVSSFRDKFAPPFFWSQSFYEAISKIGLNKNFLLLAAFFEFLGFKEIDWSNTSKLKLINNISDICFGRDDRKTKSSINISAAADRTIQDLNTFKKLSKSLGFNLFFCLQPVAGWLRKPPVKEEQILFEKTSEQVKEVLIQLCSQSTHAEYKSSIAKFCKESEICFHDLNTNIEFAEEWLFVDRVHLTDLGYSRVAKYIQDNVL